MTVRIDTLAVDVTPIDNNEGMGLLPFAKASHFTVNAVSGCWEWFRASDQHGYGCFRYEGRLQKAHRIAYVLLVGPIPDGLELDHLCRNPSCVNPAHLEPVSHYENMRRSNTPAAQNLTKTHCKRGHPFDEANTMLVEGGRRCRQCERDRQAAALRADPTRKREWDRRSHERHKEERNARRRSRAAQKRAESQ